MKKTIAILLFLSFCSAPFAHAFTGSGVFQMSATYSNAITLWDSNNGRWKLANTTYTDESGNSNTLTAVNSPTASAGHNTGSNLSTTFASATYLTINDNASLSITGSFTIAGWVYLASNNIYQTIASKWGNAISGDNFSYRFLVGDSGVLWLSVSTNGTATTNTVGNTTLNINTWYCVAARYDGTDLRVYVNSTLDNTPTAYTTGIYDGIAPFMLGRTNFSSALFPFNGRIDDLAIWSRALSTAELTTFCAGGDDFGGL